MITTRLTQAEATELLHLRVSAIENALTELFDGFYTDFQEYIQNNLTQNMTAAQRSKVLTELETIKGKYRPRGVK